MVKNEQDEVIEANNQVLGGLLDDLAALGDLFGKPKRREKVKLPTGWRLLWLRVRSVLRWRGPVARVRKGRIER